MGALLFDTDFVSQLKLITLPFILFFFKKEEPNCHLQIVITCTKLPLPVPKQTTTRSAPDTALVTDTESYTLHLALEALHPSAKATEEAMPGDLALEW